MEANKKRQGSYINTLPTIASHVFNFYIKRFLGKIGASAYPSIPPHSRIYYAFGG